MLKKVLIANRGEIALRIIRACRDLGVRSVAIHSNPDENARYVHEADEAVSIGGASARESYLSVAAIMRAVHESGADALHPGYGFLSENPALARAVADAGLTFIGPPADVIAALGSKLATREMMLEAGVPVPPGSDVHGTTEEIESVAASIGYPVLVKPSGGGGGRGMRVVQGPDDLAHALEVSRREAAGSFGDSDVYVEKLITGARHIEVQVLADTHGNVVHVGDRDCSLQRRHQKVIEEGPAPGLTDAQHQHVRELAITAVRAAKYVNAGTVEFLFDGEQFYLLEVNTRIQVEHGVTEMISGIDLVAEQIRIAAGEPLGFAQDDVRLTGTAIECRVYAEDPTHGFMPSTGRIVAARFPAGPWVREDRSVEVGDIITPYYDGMIAKLVVWGPTREVTVARTRRALGEYRIEGVETNVRLLRWVIGTPTFVAHGYDTRFIERELRPDLLPAAPPFSGAGAAPAGPPPAPAAAPTPPTPGALGAPVARRVEIFVHKDLLIHVVPTEAGAVEAIPVSPKTQRWADPEHRRRAASADQALDLLVREVLEHRELDEIFPEIGISY